MGNGSMGEKRVFRQFMFNEVPECPPRFFAEDDYVKYSDGPPPEHA